MKISKQDAYNWFSFFAELPYGEEILPKQQEIVYSTLSQIEASVEARRKKMQKEIPGLQTLEDRTFFVGEPEHFPKGCRSCLLGTGLGAVRKTNVCNVRCPFCYDYGVMEQIPPIGEGYWEIGGTRIREEDVPLLLSTSRIAYVYLEPFCEIDAYYGIIGRFAESGVYQHLYTNGTLATKDSLKKLGEAGLPEIRFNLGASGFSDTVIEKMAIAKEYIPMVGIETPMTPEAFESYLAKKEKILGTGIDFINNAELHLNENNLVNYMGEDLYMYRAGYLSPIWSRDLTLKLMKIAGEEKWPVVVHDCSNRTKYARGFNMKAKEGGWFGASDYASEFSAIPFEAFLPVLANPEFMFLEEEPLPPGYGAGDIVL